MSDSVTYANLFVKLSTVLPSSTDCEVDKNSYGQTIRILVQE